MPVGRAFPQDQDPKLSASNPRRTLVRRKRGQSSAKRPRARALGHLVSSCEMSCFQQVSVSLDDDFAGETWARSQAMRLKSLISMVDAVGIEPTTLPVKGALSSSCIGDDAMKFTSKDCGLFDGCGGLVEPWEPIGRPRFPCPPLARRADRQRCTKLPWHPYCWPLAAGSILSN